MATSRIIELAGIIDAKTKEVDSYLRTQSLPQPSFDEDGPVDVSIALPAVEASRMQAIDAALELHDLLIGPMELVRPVLNATSLQYIYKYDIASKVPLGGNIAYSNLSRQLGQEEQLVRRVIRFAISHHRIFQELQEGFVSHSAASRYLRQDAAATDGLGVMFDETYQAFAHTVEALDDRQAEGKPKRTGWSVANNTDLPLFAAIPSHPDKGRRFASAMASFSKRPTLDVSLLVNGYDWGSLGSATVVDVGGADGYTSAALASQFPNLKFQVQDLPAIIEKFKDAAPPESKDRISFVGHDFFQPQTEKAKVFLLRQILHNWSDQHCVKILQALIPGLEPGSRVIINDHLIEAPGKAPLHLDRRARDMDMIMLSLFNERDYEAQDWRNLFQTADSRFGDIKISQPPGSQLAIVEAVWSG